MVEPVVRAALLEDLGRAGDLTTDAIVPAGAGRDALVAREPGIVAGLMWHACLRAHRSERSRLGSSGRTAPRQPGGARRHRGPARGILTAERVALNFLGHLSGIATATATLVEAVRGTSARITCTRKTTPGLRALEKYAVRVGGGVNHRFGLDDAILIKDNHIAAAGGIAAAIERGARGRRSSRQDRGRSR